MFFIACLAQGILWTLWWDDPTHFKMSILFVWPAAIFSLTIWWVFFSGQSLLLRLLSVTGVVAAFFGFFNIYRLEWDGDMVPRRIVHRSTPTAEEVARQYFEKKAAVAESEKPPAEPVTHAIQKLVASDGDWTGFRGPRRDGVVMGGSLRLNWDSAPPKVIWQHPVGRAWSAFCVVGRYAITQEQRGEIECVVAYDAATGNEIWVHEDKALLSIVDANGGPGPHGTPEFDDGLIYSLGGTGILNCLEATTGSSIWSTNILTDAGDGAIPAKPPQWGVSNSPLIVDNLVIVIPGGSVTVDKGVAAYDKKSGQLVWTHGKHEASYGSAKVESFGETRQVLVPNGDGLSGHALRDGRELWFFRLSNDPKVDSAMAWRMDDGSVLFGTGYGVGTSRIDLTESGNTWKAEARWHTKRFRPKFNDFVVRDGHLYGLDDGTLTCVDLEKGAIKWKAGRYGYGQLLLIDDVLLIISEDGDLVLVKAEPTKSEPLGTFKLFTSGFCWNNLALVRGRLFARNANEAACVDVSAEPSTN